MARQLRRATLLAPFMLLAGFLALSCFDSPSGPRIFQGQFSLAPRFESAVADIITIDRFRVLVRRTSDSSTALDTVITVVPGTDSVDLSLRVPMLTSSETFLLTLSLITPAGDTAFQAGPTTVTPTSTGGAPPVIPLTVVYVGVGAEAASVRIVTASSSVFFGDTVTLVAEALDSGGAVIPGTPIAWASLDTLRARVPDITQGKVVGAVQRGGARITTTLLTGQADTTVVLVQPLPVRGIVESGDDQSAQVATLLSQPVRFRVKAADSLGVSGLKVTFSVATGGGSLDLDSAITNDSGRVEVQWTLGPGTGLQTIQARVAADFADSLVTASATALAGPADSLVFVVAPVTTAAGTAIVPPVQVAVLDSFGNTAAGSSAAVTLAIAAGTGVPGAALLGTTTRNAVAGVATFDDLRIDSVGTNYRLVATATGLTEATSGTFDVTVGAIASVTITPSLDTLPRLGDTTRFSALARDAGNNVVPGAIFTWSTSDNAVAIVDAAGLATAVGAGTALVIAETGGLADTATLVVGQTAASVVISPAADTATALGDTLQFTAQAFDAGSNPIAVAVVVWISTDPLVAVVDTGGRAVAVANGTAQIIALADGVADTATVLVSQIATQLAFTFQPTNTATGDTITPPVVVVFQDARSKVVTTATDSVFIALADNPAGATLFGRTRVQAVAGVATFDSLSLDNIGAGYTLQATAVSFPPITSAPFDIVAPPARVSWLAAVSGNWSDGTRWSTGAPPAALDTVLITQGGTYTVTLDVAPAFADLTFGGSTGTQTLVVNGQTVTVTGNSLTVGPNAVVNFGSGTINGPGMVYIFGTLNWTGGTMSDSGITWVQAGGLLNVDGGGSKYLQRRVLFNSGTMVFPATTGTGPLYLWDGPIIDNQAGGVIDFQSTGDMPFYSGTVGTLANFGTLRKSAGAGLSTIGINLSNLGVVEVQSDTLQFTQGGGGTGSFTVAADAQLDFGGSGTRDFPAGSSISGAGTVSASGGTLYVAGAYNVTGRTVVLNGSLFFAAAEPDTAFTRVLEISNGSQTGTGIVSVTDSMIWTGGSLTQAGETFIGPSAVLLVDGASTKYLQARTLVIAGTMIFPATTGTGTLYLWDGPTIVNAGLIDIQTGADIPFYSGTVGTFTNVSVGTLRKSAGPGRSTVGANLANDGTVEALGDTLEFTHGGTSTGSFTVAAGAQLAFGGAGTRTLAVGSSVSGAGLVSQTGGTTTI
ncbi:MAG TPA: hypothetical protein VJL31_02995, partial [Gemmatimonadales bacterium]|nr:hypothetical protein [Gemmatimonadales bacterium]